MPLAMVVLEVSKIELSTSAIATAVPFSVNVAVQPVAVRSTVVTVVVVVAVLLITTLSTPMRSPDEAEPSCKVKTKFPDAATGVARVMVFVPIACVLTSDTAVTDPRVPLAPLKYAHVPVVVLVPDVNVAYSTPL